MGRQSSIRRLPPEIRELIGRLRRDGRTIEEIVAKLGELDIATSKSTVGRWTRQLDAIAEEASRNRYLSEALVDRLGEEPDNKVARMNIELMHSVLTRLHFGADGRPVELDPRQVLFMSTALQKLASAQKLDVERTLKLQQAVAEKAADRAVEAADQQSRANGHVLPPEALAAIREQVYGIVER
jgi:hypothetical protein